MDNIRPSAPSTTSAAGSRPCLLPAVTLSPASTPPSDVTANSLECWPGQSPNGIYTDVVSPTPIRSANLEQSRSPLQLNNTGARRQHSPPLSPPLSPISPVSAAIPPIEAVQVIVKEDKETQPDILTPNLTEVSLQPHLARRESIQSECCGILAHEFIHPSNACGKDNTTSAIEHSLASASGLCVHASDRNIEPMVSVIGVNTPRIATPGNLGCINHSVQMMITKGSAASCSQLGVDPLQCQISLDIYAGLGGARRISTDTSLIHAGAHNVLPSMNTKAGLGVQQLAVDTMLEECCRKVNDSEAGALGSLVTKGGDILCGSDQSPSTPPTSSSSKKTGISFLDKQAFLKQQLKLRDDARRRRELQPASAVSGDSSAALQSSECVATVVDQSMRRAAVSALQELGFLRKEGSHFCNKTTTQSTAAMTASSPSSDLLPIQRFLASSSSNLFGDRQLCPQVVTVPPSGADSNNSTRSLPAEFPECLFQRPPSSPSKSPSSTYSSLARSPLRPRRTLTVEAPPVYFGHRPLSPNTNEQCLLPDSAFKQEYVPAAQQEKRPEERPRYEGRPRHASTLSISSTASSLTLTSNSRPQSSYLKDSLQDTESSDLELQIMEMQQSCNNSSGGVSKLRSPEPSKDISLLTTRLANLQVMDHYCPVDEGTSAQTPSKVEAKDTQNGFGKIFPHLGETVDSAPLYTVPAVQGGNGFDEWLAADFSSLGGTSSSEDSSASSSPLSVLDDSPLLGFDSFSTMTGTSLLDMSMAFPTLTPEVAPLVTLLTPAPAPMVDGMPLTSLAVQQAAAALNIPWTPSLERALMTQAALQAAAVAVSANATVAVAPLSQAMPLPLIKDEAIPLALPVPMAAPKEPSVAPFVAAPVAPVTAAASADSEPAPVHRVVMRGKGSKKRCLSIEEEQEEIVTKRAKNTDAAR
ncbi:hypothetical protein BGW38_002744, partial [Lunasporangiospora selenospora]